MEFISGGNIFFKNFSVNLCKGRVILEGENIFSKSPPSPRVPYINFVSVLSGV